MLFSNGKYIEVLHCKTLKTMNYSKLFSAVNEKIPKCKHTKDLFQVCLVDIASEAPNMQHSGFWGWSSQFPAVE